LHAIPADTAEMVRPLALTKQWGAPFSPAEQAQYAKGRAMAVLTATCLALLAIGFLLERAARPPLAAHVVYLGAAVAGGWFALRSTLHALARGRFDVNLLMIVAAIGAASIGYF